MNLTLDDLILPCGECNGTGEKPEQTAEQMHQQYGRNLVARFKSPDCPAYEGTGRGQLTETGKAIKDLLDVLKKKRQI